jgi:hypothetical protein
MKRAALVLTGVLLAPASGNAQRALPNGPDGYPVAPTGLEG